MQKVWKVLEQKLWSFYFFPFLPLKNLRLKKNGMIDFRLTPLRLLWHCVHNICIDQLAETGEIGGRIQRCFMDLPVFKKNRESMNVIQQNQQIGE